MSTLQEIEAAIGKLPRGEFWELARWFEEQRNKVRDQEFEEDARSGGKLHQLAQQASKEIEAGETQPLDEFLGNP